MKKTLSFLLGVLILISACNFKKNKVVIEGKFIFSRSETLYLEEIDVFEKKLSDSTTINEKGEFKFVIKNIEEPTFFALSVDKKNRIILLVDKGEKINVEADIRNILGTYKVSGSKDSEILQEFNYTTQQNYAKLDSMAKFWEEHKYDARKLEIRDSLNNEAIKVYEQQREFSKQFIEKNINSLAVITVLYQYFGRNPLFPEMEYLELYEKVAKNLETKYKNNKHVNELKARVEKLKIEKKEKEEIEKRLQVGQIIPPLSLPDKDGNPVSLKDLQEKPCLVVFWESQNILSRKFIKDVLDLQKINKKADFYVYAVSLDTDKKIWLNVIEIEKFKIINVCDFKGWLSPVLKIFQIKQLPKSFLVDNEGRIVFVNPTINELMTYFQ